MTDDEPYRPRLHFSPKAGWINDPNGLIRVDGLWHMFYQHEPHANVHGPMHWGHASSADLVTWTEHPVALYPDALGTCFSGSAVETPAGEIKLFYTAHRKYPDGSDCQVQCLVHANRELTQFESDERNPVIDNPGFSAFRDPKVFWHEPTKRWIMVLTLGQSIGIYSSADLVAWQQESVFGEAEGRHGQGPWECPDLVELVTAEGTTRWVLIVGIGANAYADGSGTQYFIGTFDGRHFLNDNPRGTALWLDYGRDYYAAQSFFGAGEALTVAWLSNWQYAAKTPTRAFRGAMTLPRKLTLVRTKDGLRLHQHVVPAVARAFETVSSGTTPRTGTYHVLAHLAPDDQRLEITLFGEAKPHFVIDRAAEGLVSLRTTREGIYGIPRFAHDYTVDLPADLPLDIDIFVDNGIVELGVGGVVWITSLYFPTEPAAQVRLIADRGWRPFED